MLQSPEGKHCSGAVAEHLESVLRISLIVYREWRVFLRSVLDWIYLGSRVCNPFNS